MLRYNYNWCSQDTVLLKKEKLLGNMVLELFTTFMLVENQFPASWLKDQNPAHLLAVVVLAFIEFALCNIVRLYGVLTYLKVR